MDDRLSHAMERRAFQIGMELQKLKLGGTVAATRPVAVRVDGGWEYQWQFITYKNPFEDIRLPSRPEGWDVYKVIATTGVQPE